MPWVENTFTMSQRYIKIALIFKIVFVFGAPSLTNYNSNCEITQNGTILSVYYVNKKTFQYRIYQAIPIVSKIELNSIPSFANCCYLSALIESINMC